MWSGVFGEKQLTSVFVAGAHAPPHGAARTYVRSPAREQSQHESAHGERGDAAQYVTPPLACLRPRMAPRRACPAPQCRSRPAHPAAAWPLQARRRVERLLSADGLTLTAFSLRAVGSMNMAPRSPGTLTQVRVWSTLCGARVQRSCAVRASRSMGGVVEQDPERAWAM